MVKNAIIGTVGDSINPLIEHINSVKPDLVYFIHSYKTKKSAFHIQRLTNVEEYRYKLLNDHEDVNEAFSKSLECIDELFKENYIVVGNFTAATKTMSVGLAMACVEKHCGYVYGTGDRDKESGNVKIYGRDILQVNPYEKQAINEFKRGKLLFDECQFLAARENFKQALIKLNEDSNLNNLKLQADIFIRIIDFYELWDKFNDELNEFKLNIILNNIIDDIKSNTYLFDYFSFEFPNFLKQMDNNLLFLNKKLMEDNLFYYLPDLLNNAQRRIDEGKYDDAGLCPIWY